MGSCSECARNCVIIHQQKKNELAVTSFFKVMFCDKYSELMFLPPKFAATVSQLVDHTFSLEDSQGLRWPVTISIVDGSLAFKQGWSAFFRDHGLELGDFIFFFYLHSHFVVKIYDKSGCEKLDFPERNMNKKRTRSNRKHASRVEPSEPGDSNSTETKSSSTSFSSRCSREEDMLPIKEILQHHSKGRWQENPGDCVEDWFFLADVATRNKQTRDRRLPFDLSDFEQHGDNLSANGSKTKIEKTNFSKKTYFGGDKHFDERPLASQCNIRDFELNASEYTEKATPKEPDCIRSRSMSTTKTHQHSKPQLPNPTATVVKNKGSDLLNLGIKEHEGAKRKNALATFSASGPCKMKPLGGPELYSQHSPTGTLRTLKMEGHDGILDIVDIPTLPDDSIEVIGIALGPSCLELPSNLAATGRFRNGKKLVILKDPQNRGWPVLYYESLDITVMMSGWQAFYEANKLQPGDECLFKLEDKYDSIYNVTIIRRPELLLLPPPPINME
ncbi:hypothetical protein SAY86_021478 [Trapa natans]|uniref:TF-B3 domain-containing protein n=1 Tax=Trapa natans TaxID=22666 RepID=A0AAN7MU62_TRANT|nr:hypothetical protein SAY86_021478 [Trapa natans]